MADGFIQFYEWGPGKRQEHSVTTVGDISTYRQRVEVYSGETLPVSGPLTDTQLRASFPCKANQRIKSQHEAARSFRPGRAGA